MENQDLRAAKGAETGTERNVRYQAVCSIVEEGGYCTYGLQCLEDRLGSWVQLDCIEDVSPSRDSVLQLASRFNDLRLSPLHFRDAVLDSISA